MALSQKAPVVPPLPSDTTLTAYTTNIRRDVEDLYLNAHTHNVLTANPAPSDGTIGDIKIVSVLGHVYTVVKNSDGNWYRSADYTKI